MSSIEPQPVPPGTKNEETLRLELAIAQLLRVGVLLSFVILAFGVGATIVTRQTGYAQIRLDDLSSLLSYGGSHPYFPSTLRDIFAGLIAFRPYAIIAFGLVILIAIPVVRVAVSVIGFAIERDRLYVLITGFVLAMLLVSFLIGEAGG
jgi:uncharacterized membrane protein